MASPILVGSANATVTSTALEPVNIVKGTHSQLIAFLVLNIWPSHFGIPLLLAIIYFKKVQRHATFINLCITFIIVGISSTLLAYAGKTTGPEPSPVLCLLQASLLYGYPPMTSVAAFALVLQMFLVIRASYYGEEYLEKDHVIRTWALLVSPYIAFFVFILATAVIGAANPQNVSRSRRFFYCSVDSTPLSNSLSVFAAFFLFATIFIEGWLLFILYKRYTTLKSKNLDIKQDMDYSMPMRVLAYGVYSTVALSLSLLSIASPQSPAPDLIIATASSVYLLIFMTQRDIIKAARFWRQGPVKITPIHIEVSRDQDKLSYYNYNIDQPRPTYSAA